jgi:hypothetical protein
VSTAACGLLLSEHRLIPGARYYLTQMSKKDECYFLDEHGFVFSEAPTFSGNAYIAFYGLIDAAKIPLVQTYLNKTCFH